MSKNPPNIELPLWAHEYITPRRYKVAYGGRGPAKSWTFARLALLAAAGPTPKRILCARELQMSIKDSVHHLLISQIKKMGIEGWFDWGVNYLRSRTGSEFIFRGLRHNAEEIKSLEDVDICWVEEARFVSADSWKFLIPTIRAPGSEFWISFNTGEATDPTYSRFVESPPPNALVRKVGYKDNPWFTQEMEDERLYLRSVDYESYLHVWEGDPLQHSEAQVLRNKCSVDIFTPVTNSKEPGENWDGPYYGADWGFSTDPSTLVRLWIHEDVLYIEHEAYGLGVELDDIPKFYSNIPDVTNHTVKADNSRPETIRHVSRKKINGRTIRIQAAPKWPGSIEDGITYLRSFKKIVIHERCIHTEEEARLWKYKQDRLTGEVLPQLIDKHNHIWDAVRYALSQFIRNRGGGYAGANSSRAA